MATLPRRELRGLDGRAFEVHIGVSECGRQAPPAVFCFHLGLGCGGEAFSQPAHGAIKAPDLQLGISSPVRQSRNTARPLLPSASPSAHSRRVAREKIGRYPESII